MPTQEHDSHTFLQEWLTAATEYANWWLQIVAEVGKEKAGKTKTEYEKEKTKIIKEHILKIGSGNW